MASTATRLTIFSDNFTVSSFSSTKRLPEVFEKLSVDNSEKLVVTMAELSSYKVRGQKFVSGPLLTPR